jgi:pyruvate dehydrogenase E2 component (dihydrolipoamide acetyltransferase)
MPVDVIMPALELAQETGKVVRWLRGPGDRVQKGDAIVEIETDKVTVEVEAPASGVLGEVTAREGDVVPVGRAIARILDDAPAAAGVRASPLARRLAAEHGVDLARVKGARGKIEKADVLAHLAGRAGAASDGKAAARLAPASPKARRLAAELGVDLAMLPGSGPGGAVLASDVLAAELPAAGVSPAGVVAAARGDAPERREGAPAPRADAPALGTVWRIMAERMTASWTGAPHFYLVREVNVSRLTAWREKAARQSGARITYTDQLVKLVAAALARHPAARASWTGGGIAGHAEINVGLAVAIDDGLVVPVIHRADALGLAEIAARREDLVSRAQAGTLRPADIQGGVFTISNLGMYGVDAFDAIVNPPQAAILAVGRIADRVVALNGQPAVQPTMVLTLSCDHRVLDGARGAQFLGTLADLIEEPLTLLT